MDTLFYIQQCSSTNDEIINLLKSHDGIRELTLYTFDQTKGRGQYGNTWDTAPNQNLAFSMALLQNEVSQSDTLFNFHTANILRDFIAKKTETKVEVKWPNDIIIHHKKVSGMLIEKKKIGNNVYFIVGIGLNLLQRNVQNLPKAGSILTQTKKEFDLENWTKEMHTFFLEKVFEPVSSEEILDQYHHFLFKKDEVSVFEIDKIRQNGIIKKVDEQGYLWIDLENEGLKRFYHKEIKLLY